MDEASGHLSDVQVEQYGSRVATTQPTVGTGSAKDDHAEQIERHLADCPACRERVLVSQRTRLALAMDPPLNNPKHANQPGPHPDCLGQDALRDLAAGLCAPEKAFRLTQHAAQCNRCGSLLRSYTEDFSDDIGAEDQTVLGALNSSSAGWQQKLARRMVAEPAGSTAKSWLPTPRRPFLARWVMAPIALAASAVIVVAISYSRRETPERVEKLLAKAYTEQRTMEMRFPGAGWAPMRLTRGPEDSRFLRPQPLLEAESIIGRRQSTDTANPGWLRAKAEADILDRNPGPAIESLDQALGAQPESVPLLLDLSIAYSQQGDISLDPVNYEKATDLLGKVLQKDPHDRVALFNRALLYEQMRLIDSAIADWEAFLKSERDANWIEEARKKLAALQELKRKQSNGFSDAPQEWRAALNSDPGNVEQILDSVIMDWLPGLYSVRRADNQTNPEYAELLSAAAKELQSRHGDSWLAKLLAFDHSPHFSQGVLALRAATLLNSQGKASDAVYPARMAEYYFRQDHNLPGLARAQLEEIYAYQRSANGALCVEKSDNLRPLMALESYLWLKAQLYLDEASCLNILGRMDEAKLHAEDALSLSKTAAYPVLYVRALGINAGLATTRGDSSVAVKRDLDGLTEYWRGQFPSLRAYQFYSDLALNAESAGLWHLVLASDQEALGMIVKTANKQLEASARYRLAKAALMLHERQVAASEIERADQILAQLPKTESTAAAQVDGIIGLVRAYLSLGQYEYALAGLKRIAIPTELDKNQLIGRRRAQITGDVQLRLGHLREAQKSYLEAVSIAESSLHNLSDDHDRLRWNRDNGFSYRAATGLAVRLGNPTDGLELWELYRSAPIRRRSKPGAHAAKLNWVSESGIVSAARPELHEETIVSYAFLPDGLAIWVVDDSVFDFVFSATDPNQIRSLALRFARECGNPASDLRDLRRDASELYRMLIMPIASKLRSGRTLFLETDQELAEVPFGALVDETGRYLDEGFAIAFSPSLYTYPFRTIHKLQRTDKALIIGDPETGRGISSLPRLPSARAEATIVASKFLEPVLLVGPDASFDRVASEISRARIVHFAGHAGVVDGRIVLLLAGNDSARQTLAENSTHLIGRVRHPELAVFSACSTGSRLLEYPESFPFLRRGFAQILVTRWAIDSEATRAFMSDFYDNLLSGLAVPQSLQRSSSRLRKERTTQHPYFWAGFFMIRFPDES